jgi:glycosyltransferase involved in cell wall biosynthesis
LQKINILLTTYNSHRFLHYQLNSILNQSYSQFELIIVDDFSNDMTVSIIAEYQKNDARIRLIENKENLGCCKSFEKGLEACDGKYIILSDHDDVWYENKVEQLLKNIGDSDLIYSNCDVIDEFGVLEQYTYKDINRMIGTDSTSNDITEICAFNSYVLGCSMMLRSTMLPHILPILDDTYNHDKWIVFLVSIFGKIKYLDIPLFKYRIHGNNLSRKCANEKSNKGFFIDKSLVKPISFSRCGLIGLVDRISDTDKKVLVIDHILSMSKAKFFIKYHKFLFLRYIGARRLKKMFNWCFREQ